MMPRLQGYEPAPAGDYRPMARAQYFIVCEGHGWIIKFDGEEFGPYIDEREAKLFAVDAAYKLGQVGINSQVFVLDADGQACAAWTYGQDRYPPRL